MLNIYYFVDWQLITSMIQSLKEPGTQRAMYVAGGGESLGDEKGSVAYPISNSTVNNYLLEFT